MSAFILPSGFRIDVESVEDTPRTWNGFPAPVVGADTAFAVAAHMAAVDAAEYPDGAPYGPSEPYSPSYVGGLGFVLDGLAWQALDDDGGTRYLGVLDDPNLSPADVREAGHVFTFRSLADAVDLLDALRAGWGDYARKLDGSELGMAQFGPLSDPTITLWAYDADDTAESAHWRVCESADPYPDLQVRTGAHGLTVVDPC